MQLTPHYCPYHIEAAVLKDEHANHEREHGGHIDAEKVTRGLELQTVGRAIAIVGLNVELTGGDEVRMRQNKSVEGEVVEQHWFQNSL
jgi:hypothetical protein